MNHKNYIGKKLIDLYNNTPNYAKNFYLILAEERCKHFKAIIDDDEIMNKTIMYISDLKSDYTYIVKLKESEN